MYVCIYVHSAADRSDKTNKVPPSVNQELIDLKVDNTQITKAPGELINEKFASGVQEQFNYEENHPRSYTCM